MRDDARKHPEIVDAYQRGGHFFAAIGLCREGSERVFELGISAASYVALKRVLNCRPFDAMPGLAYRRLFLPVYGRGPGDTTDVEIRIEQGRDGKAFHFEMPKDLVANLLWFDQMTDYRPAQHLRSWQAGETSFQRTVAPKRRPWWRRLWSRRPGVSHERE
jgi:hypothetical protein